MSRRPHDGPWPKSLTYAIAIHVFYAGAILAAIAFAFVLRTLVHGEPLRANEYAIFLNIGAIYALAIFLIAILFSSYADQLADGVDRQFGNKAADAFFSKDFILSTIKWTALSTIGFGTLVFFFLMRGIARFAFPPAG